MARFIPFLVASMILCCATAAQAAADEKAAPEQIIKVRAEHPRIWLDKDRLAFLRKKVEGKSLDEVKTLAGTSATGLALVYAITGDEATGKAAIEKVRGTRGSPAVEAMSLTYDWCYPLLSSEDKKAFRETLVKQGRDLMAFKRNWRSFHNGMYSSSWDVCVSALAVYGDDPYGQEAIDYLLPEWDDSMKVFERLFPDGEWPESFDYNRHVTYPAFRYYWAVKTASGRDFMADSKHMKNASMFVIYGSKPDGLVYPSNDCDWPHLGPWDREALLMMAAEYKDPYAQYFLNHCKAERFQPYDGIMWRDLLWYDPAAPEKPLSDLPLSRVFRGDGLVIARSGWGWDEGGKTLPVSWLTFRCGDYFGDHCHYDINSFQIYYKGELAIDSGRYDPDWDHYSDEEFHRSQFFNYYQRTIAHNDVLVYDPDEKLDMPIVNDGGQRQLLLRNGKRNVPEDYDQGTFPSDDGTGTCDWATNPGRWETGDMKAYEANKDFMYVCGDATKAYSDKKLKSFVRQLVFIEPDVVVVFDRVVSTKPEFKKTWLLHSIDEPVIADNGSFELSYSEGRLVCVPLLPEKPLVTKVGGPGNEFLVGGVHYKVGMQSELEPTELNYGELPGAWRIEECPSKASSEDYFLNVMLLTDKDSKALPAAKLLPGGENEIKLEVAASGKTVVLIFAKGDASDAAVKLTVGGKTLYDRGLAKTIVPEAGRFE